MGHVLNEADFDGARAVSAAKLKELGYVAVCMAPGEMNPGHSHTLVEEMLIVRKGTGKIQIEDAEYDLRPGSVAIVPAGQFHAVCNTGNVNLEGVTVFNSNFDRKKVVLKNRKQHFKAAAKAAQKAEKKAEKKAAKKALKRGKAEAQSQALVKENKRLKKRLKRLARRK